MKRRFVFGLLIGLLVASGEATDPDKANRPSPEEQIRQFLHYAQLWKKSNASAEEKQKQITGFVNRATKIAQSQLIQAQQQADQKVVLHWSRQLLEIAESELPKGSELRINAHKEVAIASYSINRGDYLKHLNAAAIEARASVKSDADKEAAALMIRALVRLQLNDDGARAAAKLLNYVTSQLKPESPFYRIAQSIVWRDGWLPIYARCEELSANGDLQAARKFLERHVKSFEEQLLENGAEKHAASWGRLLNLKFYREHLQLAAANETIKSIESNQIDVSKMPPFWQAQFGRLKSSFEMELSNYAEARRLNGDALQIAKSAGLVAEHCVLLNDLGLLLLKQGDYEAAEPVLKRAFEICEQTPNLAQSELMVNVLVNLGKTSEGKGRYSSAAKRFNQAMALVTTTLTASSEASANRMRCLCQNTIAANHYSIGHFAEARKQFLESRLIAKREYGESHIRVAEVNVNLGWTALETGDVGTASDLFSSAVEMAKLEVGVNHPRTAEMLSYLARTLVLQERMELARESLLQALELRERHLGRALRSALSERDRLALVQELRIHPEAISWPGVLDTFLDVANALSIPVEDQYQHVQRWKGVVNRHHLERGQFTSDKARQLFETRDQLLRELRVIYFSRPKRGQRRAWLGRIREMEDQANQLERELRRASGQQKAPQSELDLKSVRARLPAKTAFLDVIEIKRFRRRKDEEVVTDQRSYVGFLLTRSGKLERIDFPDGNQIDELTSTYYSQISEQELDFWETGSGLSDLIMEPMRKHLDGIETLMIAADGIFHILPLGSLPVGNSKRFWIEDLSFVMVGGAASLFKPIRAPKAAQKQGAFVVGGVDYGMIQEENPLKSWTYLPNTETEANKVAAILKARSFDVKLLKRESATEHNVSLQLEKCVIAHLATHGFFGIGINRRRFGDEFRVRDVSAEFDSAVVLSGANRNRTISDADDQLLTSAEIAQLDLSGLELVVLSACQTGLGYVRAGQGLVGLLGALERAGVGIVVSSLWEVNDEATAKLMTNFYELLSTPGKLESVQSALRSVQLDMIHQKIKPEGGGSFAHPRYWAAFVITGTSMTDNSQ